MAREKGKYKIEIKKYAIRLSEMDRFKGNRKLLREFLAQEHGIVLSSSTLGDWLVKDRDKILHAEDDEAFKVRDEKDEMAPESAQHNPEEEHAGIAQQPDDSTEHPRALGRPKNVTRRRSFPSSVTGDGLSNEFRRSQTPGSVRPVGTPGDIAAAAAAAHLDNDGSFSSSLLLTTNGRSDTEEERNTYTIEEKKYVIHLSEQEPFKNNRKALLAYLQQERGLALSTSTLSDWLTKDRQKILDAPNNQAVRLREPKYKDLDVKLSAWIRAEVEAGRVPVKPKRVREAAREMMARDHPEVDFVASNGWLWRVMKRAGVAVEGGEAGMAGGLLEGSPGAMEVDGGGRGGTTDPFPPPPFGPASAAVSAKRAARLLRDSGRAPMTMTSLLQANCGSQVLSLAGIPHGTLVTTPGEAAVTPGVRAAGGFLGSGFLGAGGGERQAGAHAAEEDEEGAVRRAVGVVEAFLGQEGEGEVMEKWRAVRRKVEERLEKKRGGEEGEEEEDTEEGEEGGSGEVAEMHDVA